MPGGEHKAVAVGPGRLGRVVLQEARPKDVGHGRRAHGHARMARIGLLHAINGKKANGIDAELIELRGSGTRNLRQGKQFDFPSY